MKKPVYVLVLNDGETFTDLSDCTIWDVSESIDPEHPLETARCVGTFTEDKLYLDHTIVQIEIKL